MINRVASSAGTRMMQTNLQISARNLLAAQEQMTTGKRINRVSDNPADAVSSLGQRASLRRLEQFSRNAVQAQSWFDAGDTALSSVNERLSSARALVVQGNSGASDAQSRAAIANEMMALRDSILQSANASRDGRQIFAGTSGASVAYDANGLYQGDTGTVSIPITPGVSLQVNRTGPDVFGTRNAVDPDNGDVFQLLEQAANAVRNGDTNALGTMLAKIDVATARVSTAQIEIGGRALQLENLTASLESSKVSLSNGISAAENADFAESVISLKTQEAAYQAALAATARVIQPTLLDFLR